MPNPIIDHIRLNDTVHDIADAQARQDVSDLKSAMDEYVLDKYTIVNPNNWLNVDAMSPGQLKADGTITENEVRSFTDFIPVKEGDIVRTYYRTGTLYRFAICAYNSNKNVIESAGSNGPSSGPYTVPAQVAFVRITIENQYLSLAMITINYVPTAYEPYFAPYSELTDDFLTAESEEAITEAKSKLPLLNFDTVKGMNITENSVSGVGAYYVKEGKPYYNSSYTGFHYIIAKLKKNTDYYAQSYGSPRWYILTDGDTVIEQGESKYIKAFNSGNADTLYYTMSNAGWNVYKPIIAEGINGTTLAYQMPEFIQNLTQRNRAGRYSCTLPKQTPFFTVGIDEVFYYTNILGLKNNLVEFYFGGTTTHVEDGKKIAVQSAGTSTNGYTFTVYDENLSIIDRHEVSLFIRKADDPQDCTLLVIGDSTVQFGNMTSHLLTEFSDRGKTLTLLGTRGTSPNLNEGRSGWSAKDYCTNAERGGVTNPFYNPTTEKFDFSYYMSNQNYSAVDFVAVQLGINDLYNASYSMDIIDTTWGYIKEIIDSILTFNASQKIILNLPTPANANLTIQHNKNRELLNALYNKYNEYVLYKTLESPYNSNVRVSYCHLILNPKTDISDNVHPTDAGFAKMALEMLNQINCWQQA